MADLKSNFKKNLTIPIILSAIRIVVIVPLVKFLIEENYIGAGIMLLVSGISDMFDGMIARKMNQVTQLGKMLDPIADKLTLIAVVICINILYPSVTPFVIILFCKEIFMLCGGLFLIKIKIKPPAAKWYGKVSTAIFYVSVVTIVLLKAIWGITNMKLIIALFAVTTLSMLFSLINYAVLFFKLIKQEKK